jgi:hypothetical protein
MSESGEHPDQRGGYVDPANAEQPTYVMPTYPAPGQQGSYPPQPYSQQPYAQPTYGPPSYEQPGYAQPAYSQPVYGSPAGGQGGYGQPYPPSYYPQPAYGYPGVQNSGRATTVMVLGIASLVLLFLCGLGFIPAIVALCLAPDAKRKIASSGGRIGGEGMVKAGVIMSWIAIGLTVLGVIGYTLLIVLGSQ